MIVNSMVGIIENGKKLILVLSHSTSSASNYAERIAEKRNVNVEKIKYERDFNVIEQTYEITPLNKDAEIKITIVDDNPFDLSAHTDHVIFRFDGQKWNPTYLMHPKYH